MHTPFSMRSGLQYLDIYLVPISDNLQYLDWIDSILKYENVHKELQRIGQMVYSSCILSYSYQW